MTDQEVISSFYDLKIRSWELEQSTQELEAATDTFWKNVVGERILSLVDEFGAPYIFDGFTMEVVRVDRKSETEKGT
jgi:hypothetical protein